MSAPVMCLPRVDGPVTWPPPPLRVEGPDPWPWRPLRVDRAMGEAPPHTDPLVN
jgi:hypothetical protein